MYLCMAYDVYGVCICVWRMFVNVCVSVKVWSECARYICAHDSLIAVINCSGCMHLPVGRRTRAHPCTVTVCSWSASPCVWRWRGPFYWSDPVLAVSTCATVVCATMPVRFGFSPHVQDMLSRRRSDPVAHECTCVHMCCTYACEGRRTLFHS